MCFTMGSQMRVRHSWNFIEMAGERVVTSAKKEGKTQELDKQDWLKRKDNSKVINFVIDPTYRPPFCLF